MPEPMECSDSRGGSPRRRTLRFALGGAAVAVLCALGVGAILLATTVQGRDATGAVGAASTPAPSSSLSSSTEAIGAGEASAGDQYPDADPAWLARVSAASGVPPRALAAYARAVLVLAAEQPGCRVGWNMLAAIGKVESDHGRINGSRMLEDGSTTPRIIGVPLDGSKFLATPDTDGGAIDGDAEWDRAVGPMQFIPATWAMFGRDGNGDGRIEIDQIDDAALSAATLLCDPGLDLTVGDHWIAALDGYNPSAAYNNDVADVADEYLRLGAIR